MNTSDQALLIKILLLSLLLWPLAGHAAAVTEYQYRVIKQYPHDPQIFTQGLEIYQGQLLESAGQYGHSSLSLRTLDSTDVLKSHTVAASFFAEGISQLNGRIYQLTWKSGAVFVYNADSFAPLSSVKISGEGWGLTNDGKALIMSNGSNQLHFINPKDFSIYRSLAVSYQGKPVQYLNELEWVDGKIYANIWQTDWIVIIDPQSGHITGKVNLEDLKPLGSDVLNGIAYDHVNRRLHVTGKYWPHLYQIELLPQ
jgi:glutamine cyclotransferase